MFLMFKVSESTVLVHQTSDIDYGYRYIDIHPLIRLEPNKIACVTSKDSDQPGRSPSLIRVFAGFRNKALSP